MSSHGKLPAPSPTDEILSLIEARRPETWDAALTLSTTLAVINGKGKFLYVNDAFCQITRFSRGELIGKTYALLKAGQHPPEFFKGIRDKLRSRMIWKGPVCGRRKDGELVWVDVTVVPIQDERNRSYQYFVLCHDITRQKEMEEVLKNLPQMLIEAQELERERISREIHDDLGQSLATFKLLIQSTLDTLDFSPSLRDKVRGSIVGHLDSIIEKSRQLTSILRPATLEMLGLTASLESLFADFRMTTGVKLRVCLGDLDDLILSGEPINLYRILQEALANILHHAQAQKVSVTFRKLENDLSITIKDDGRGFVRWQEKDLAPSYGFGMSTMKERTRLLKGDIQIHSLPGRGTVIHLRLPVKRRKRAHAALSDHSDR